VPFFSAIRGTPFEVANKETRVNDNQIKKALSDEENALFYRLLGNYKAKNLHGKLLIRLNQAQGRLDMTSSTTP
jgi:hypothetical protein